MTATPAGGARPLRVLLVDDSEVSRGTLERLLEETGWLKVVACARDGEEALGLAITHRPDLVLLDVQMPRMDGFTFLRLLMGRHPVPVIVLSSQSRRSDVFKSLELGALDFVAKPESGGLESIREELLAKCELVRSLRIGNLGPIAPAERTPAAPRPIVEPPAVAVVGASTGGPRALQTLLAGLPGDLPLGVLISQHMPEKFTKAFAERLTRTTRFVAFEATDGDLVAAGRVLVAPGGAHLAVGREGGPSGALRARLVPASSSDPSPRYCPSIDQLFSSAAAVLGRRLCGVVLTGMGSDGTGGCRAIRAAGGLTLAESAETAVIYGMPGSAVAAGVVDEVLPLPAIAARLIRFARGT